MLLFFILIISATSLIAQLEKGDWMLSGDNSFNIHGFNPDYIGNISLKETIGLMFSDHIMLGAGFAIGGSRFLFTDEEKHKNYWKGASLFFRYKLLDKNKSVLLAEFQSQFIVTEEKSINFHNKQKGQQFDIGLVYQYFVTPNIAMELVMGSKFFENGNLRKSSTNPKRFYINMGFKTFLKIPVKRISSLQEDYLKKGNYLISGYGFLRPSYANRINLFYEQNTSNLPPASGINIGLFPSMKFFKTDHWLVGGNVELGLLSTDAGYRFHAGLGMNSSFYIPLKKQLYLLPTIGFTFSRRLINADKQIPSLLPSSPPIIIKDKASIQIIRFPLSLAFTYFKGKSTVLSTGASLNMSFSQTTTLLDNNNVRGSVFFNLEYFVAPNLSINSTMSHFFQVKELEKIFFNETSRFSLSGYNLIFGLNYFLFQK